MFCERRAVGDETDAADDEDDSKPAVGRDVLMLPEASQQSDHDISKRRGGENKGKISPTECREVAGEEAQQEKNAADDPGIAQSSNEKSKMLQRDGANLAHAMRKQRIAHGGGEHDAEQDQVTLGSEGVFHCSIGTEHCFLQEEAASMLAAVDRVSTA